MLVKAKNKDLLSLLFSDNSYSDLENQESEYKDDIKEDFDDELVAQKFDEEKLEKKDFEKELPLFKNGIKLFCKHLLWKN